MIKIQGLNFVKKHIAIIIFLVLYLAIALLTYKDFGATWDEFVNYNGGVITYEHIFDKKVEHPLKSLVTRSPFQLNLPTESITGRLAYEACKIPCFIAIDFIFNLFKSFLQSKF